MINVPASSAHQVIRVARDTQAMLSKEAPELCWALTHDVHSREPIAKVYQEQLLTLFQYRFYLSDFLL